MISARSQAASSRSRLVTAGQRENAERRAISLLGMRTVAHHPLDQNGGVDPDPCRLVDQDAGVVLA